MPGLLRKMFPRGLVWDAPTPTGKEVYLTFDDGPHPTATPFVLQQLKSFGMQGTFFCIGKNVKEHPAIYQRLVDEGHGIGNHTMHHLNGRKTETSQYLQNVEDASGHINSRLFRPPYGQINSAQAAAIKDKFPGMQIVMWSVLSGDFDVNATGLQCFKKSIRHIKPGAIIVFHDSEKAFPRLKEALPLTLQWLAERGFVSRVLTP